MIAIAGDPPQFHDVRDPGWIYGAIDGAENYWDETGDLAGTVAVLAARISMHQPFRDTNHRTAHAIAHAFLEANGFDWLAPPNDVALEEILKKDRDPERTLREQINEIAELFRSRMGRQG